MARLGQSLPPQGKRDAERSRSTRNPSDDSDAELARSIQSGCSPIGNAGMAARMVPMPRGEGHAQARLWKTTVKITLAGSEMIEQRSFD